MQNHPQEPRSDTPVIAIDGHAGAGKSTVADLVASALGFWHVNTGLYYRAVTWLAFGQGIAAEDQARIEALAASANIEVRETGNHQEVFVDGQAVTDQVRTPAINRAISLISAYPGVREAITGRLQRLRHPRGIIMDGRDIGTVVFPYAPLKIFLTASVEERARRQHEEALGRGQQISYEELKELISQRDRLDSQRAVAPLRQAEDAVCLDSTGATPQDMAARILQMWKERVQSLDLLDSPGPLY